jgi:hypothetical protein
LLGLAAFSFVRENPLEPTECQNGTSPEQLKTIFSKEARDMPGFYLAGYIEQWWACQDQKVPVFPNRPTNVCPAVPFAKPQAPLRIRTGDQRF